MGACLGRCFASILERFSNRSYQRHTDVSIQGDEIVEYDLSVDESNELDCNESRSKTFLSFFSLKQFKQNHIRVPVTMELIEETGWPGRSNKYARLSSKNVSTSSGLDNPLQMLDPKGLLVHHGGVSSAASSVDLEWEHEGLPMPAIPDNDKIENIIKIENSPEGSLSELSVHNSQPSSLTASPWSRVSTPNSLEWDPVEADIVDVETEKLLVEIERLTDRALKETGDWTSTS